MLLIAITPPEETGNEVSRIITLLNKGFDYVHLRKPNYTTDKMRRLLNAIPSHLLQHITLGSHQDLAMEYAVGGVHHNSRYTSRPGCGLRYSISCHTTQEVTEAQHRDYDYAFLSPIFDSISKSGYKSAFNPPELKPFLQTATIPVVALGGVTDSRLAEVKDMGFAGAAFLGHLFEDCPEHIFNQRLQNILKLK